MNIVLSISLKALKTLVLYPSSLNSFSNRFLAGINNSPTSYRPELLKGMGACVTVLPQMEMDSGVRKLKLKKDRI